MREREKFNFNNILEEDEKIIWREKPNYKRYMRMSRICVAVCILFSLILTLLIFIGNNFSMSESIDTIIILAFIVIISFAWYGSQKWKYKHLSFVFTNKRIFFPKTSFAEEYNSIEYSKIDGNKLKIERADKRNQTGTITVTENYKAIPTVYLFLVDNPNDVVKQLKEIIAEPEIVQQSMIQLEKHIEESKTVKISRIKKYRFDIILLTVGIVFVAALTTWFMSWMLEYEASPEQITQAEVINKKMENSDGYYYFYITFKFPDGFVKEIEIMNFPSSSSKNREKAYNSIHKGETGILTYKYFHFDRFLSFEKAPEYGGQKIEEYRMMTNKEYMAAFICIVVITSAGSVILVVFITKRRKSKLYITPEAIVYAKVKRKIIEKNDFYICFQFLNGTDKLLKVEPEIYKEIKEEQTGKLLYKEYIPPMEQMGFNMMRIEDTTIENETFMSCEKAIAKEYRIFIRFDKNIK